MKKAVVFLADGFEDIEALAPVDILRRGGVDLTIAGVTGMQVVSSHNVKIMADKDFTMYPGMENNAPSGSYKNDKFVVKDGKVITGAGPAAAFEYAFELLAELQGKEIASQVAKGMLFK